MGGLEKWAGVGSVEEVKSKGFLVIGQIPAEHLLCARHCCGHWDRSDESRSSEQED